VSRVDHIQTTILTFTRLTSDSLKGGNDVRRLPQP